MASVKNNSLEQVETAQTWQTKDSELAKPQAVEYLDVEVDKKIEKSLIRKLDTRLVPLLSVLYLLAFLDRSNIGNAKIAGMQTDLHLTAPQYNWLLTIFYIGYIIAAPLTLVYKVLPMHMWAAFVVFGWGAIATLQAVVSNWSGLMACRFFLGVVEQAYGPAVPYLMSFFYLRREVGFRTGIFLSMAPLATTFSGALAYGITSGHASIANWKLLFIVEGLPTVVMAVVTWFCLPDNPEKATYLTPEEKRVAAARTIRQVGHTDGEEHRVGRIVWSEVRDALLDLKCWFTALMYFSCNVSFASLPVFLPTILTELGFTAINAQGLSAPPYFVSFLVTFTSVWIADRTGQRGLMIAGLSTMGGIGYVLLATVDSVGVKYFGVYLAAAGIFPSIANILPWVLNNQGTDTRRGVGIALLNLVGQCGPLLGTNVYTDAPKYTKGFSICAAFIFFNAFLALGLRTLLKYENKKLDEKYGPADNEGPEAGEEGYGRNFRYIL